MCRSLTFEQQGRIGDVVRTVGPDAIKGLTAEGVKDLFKDVGGRIVAANADQLYEKYGPTAPIVANYEDLMKSLEEPDEVKKSKAVEAARGMLLTLYIHECDRVAGVDHAFKNFGMKTCASCCRSWSCQVKSFLHPLQARWTSSSSPHSPSTSLDY